MPAPRTAVLMAYGRSWRDDRAGGLPPGFYSSSQQNGSGFVLVAIRFWIGQGGETALDSCRLLIRDPPMSPTTAPCVRVDCADWDSLDSLWRMLSHVPDQDFRPVELAIAGEPLYRVVRRDATGQSSEPIT